MTDKCFVCSLNKALLPFPPGLTPVEAAAMLSFIMGLRTGLTSEIPSMCEHHMSHIASGVAVILRNHPEQLRAWCERTGVTLTQEMFERTSS